MSKSVLYAGNNLSQATIAGGTVISMPNIIRRYGCDLTVINGNAVVENCGYYKGEANITIVGTVAGTATVTVLMDNVAIPYAVGSTLTTDGSIQSITIPFIVRKKCACDESVITVVVSGVATNVTNASMTIERA